jgi:outer membrane receptor protein involved in Fe transport
LIWALALVLASFGVATAQETTSGSLAGEVLDNQGAAIPGATVTVTSGQGSRSIVTDANGRFFAPFLTPGSYSVKVELAGFSPVEQKNINVRLGQRLDLSFTLKVGDIQEVVEVVGAAPVIDTSSTTAGGTLDSDQLQRLPVGRNFTQTLYLVPGVSDSSGVGNANPSIGGASGLENNYVVDGANITNQGYGGVGVYSITFGSLGTGVTTDFIKETQVKTAGFEAEYGQATGGVVNVVTKSGTNAFHGSLFSYFQPDFLEATRDTVQTTNGTVNDTAGSNYDFGVSLGGPLVKDKLFFFGAFNPQYNTLARTAPDGFPLASLGEVDRKRRTYSYAGKLTFQATANHRFDFSAFGDPSHGDLGPQRTNALKGAADQGRFSELDFYGGHNQALRYDGIISPSWLIEASASRAYTNITETPGLDLPSITDRTVVPNLVLGGVGFYDQDQKGKNLQLSLKSTNIFNAGGRHQLRYGAQWESVGYNRGFNRSGPTFTLFPPNGAPFQSSTGAQIQILPDPAYGEIYRVTRANYGPIIETNQKYLNFFAQDTWQIGSRLTFKPGLRWERQRLSSTLIPGHPYCYEGESQVGAVANGLEAATGPGIGCSYTWSNNWSPRIGATYDVTGNGKSKVYGSWGRFFAKIPNDLAARALAADAGITRADYFDAGLTQPVPNGVVALGTGTHYQDAGATPSIFANNTKSSYSDELIGGIEYEVAPSVNLGVRYIHRNTSTVLEDYAQATPVMYELGFPGLASVVYNINNISASLPTLDPTTTPGFERLGRSSFEDPVHKYDAIEVTANKSFAGHWSLLASYRYSRLRGNFEGFYRSDNGQSDPSITSLFDFPTNDPSYSEIGGPEFGFLGDIRYQGNTLGEGKLPNERPHQVKLYATYTWSNLNLGLGFNAGSGRNLTALAGNPVYGNSGEIPLTIRGGGLVPVAGTSSNAPGVGLLHTDAEIQFDIHADYTLKFGDSRRLIVLADVFNLFNDQSPTWFDVYPETTPGALNPNYGQPLFGGAANINSFRLPRQVRLGARFEW